MRSFGIEKKLLLVYLAIWVFSVVFYWFFTTGSDAMGYALLFLWGLNPLAVFVVSFLLRRKGSWGSRVWASPLIFGVMSMLLPYVTLDVSNTLAFGNIHAPDFLMFFLGLLASVLGLGLSVLVDRVAKR